MRKHLTFASALALAVIFGLYLVALADVPASTSLLSDAGKIVGVPVRKLTTADDGKTLVFVNQSSAFKMRAVGAGGSGTPGAAATVAVGTTTTGAAGSNASVTNSGTSSAAVLNFTIPRGNTGVAGKGVSSIAKTGTAGLTDTYTITYTDSTTSTFTVTNGAAGTTGAAGRGVSTIAKTGTAGVIDTYTVTYSDASTSTFTVTNGTNGADGQAATVAVGTVTTGAAGTSVQITNSGTSSAAVLNFTIPKGDTGASGTGTGTVNTGTAGNIAYYSANGTTVSGTTALPNGTTATTQAAGDSSTKVATTGYVDTGLAGKANASSLGTASTKDVPISGNASTLQVVKGDDTRLTDARTPLAHNQAATTITEDATHRFATDAEKTAWNAKQSALVAGTDYLAPSGSGASLTSLNASSISTGTLAAARGGAGTVNGIMKANGSGTVSAAVAGTDYALPYASQLANYVLAAPNGSAGTPLFRALVAADIPTLNQSTTGNAATATKLATARNINGVAFDGTANITVADNTKEPSLGNPGANGYVLASTTGGTRSWVPQSGTTLTTASGYPSTSDTTAATPAYVKAVFDSYTGTPATAANVTSLWNGTGLMKTDGTAATIPTCSGTDKLTANGSTITCAADQTGAGGSGITSLNGLSATTQSFANDTNVTVTSATSTHTLGWSGYLSKARGGAGADMTNVTFPASGTLLTTTGSAANLTGFPTLNQNTTGTAAGLTAQYIDWALSSGGASIKNKPTTLAGYGITDAYTTAFLDAALAGKLDTGTASSTYVSKSAFGNYTSGKIGTDGSYGWTTSTNSSTFTDCTPGKYGFDWIAGVLYQCVNGVNSVFYSGGGGSMTYPSAGIPVSTGSAWTTSLPVPPGGASQYLRADGTWATPPAGGASTGGDLIPVSVTSDTTIQRGYDYEVNASVRLTFRNISSGRIKIFTNNTTAVLIPASATAQFRGVHPSVFQPWSTSRGYSLRIPSNTRLELVNYGSNVWRAVMTTQPLTKTGINEYANVTTYLLDGSGNYLTDGTNRLIY